MPVTQTSYVERVLIVLNPDGTLKGAHQERSSEIKDGDTVLSVRQEGAEPINAAIVASVLPSATYISQAASLTAQLETVTAERDAARAQIKATPVPEVINGVPQVVSDLQARRALLGAGLLPAVENAVVAAGGDAAIYWERSTSIRRDSQFIASIGPQLGLNAGQIDNLFIVAAQL